MKIYIKRKFYCMNATYIHIQFPLGRYLWMYWSKLIENYKWETNFLLLQTIICQQKSVWRLMVAKQQQQQQLKKSTNILIFFVSFIPIKSIAGNRFSSKSHMRLVLNYLNYTHADTHLYNLTCWHMILFQINHY